MYYLLLFLMIACNDYAIKNDIRHGPELVVYPDSLDFGHLISGQENGQTSFAIINAGDEDLIINRPELDSELRFSLDNDLQQEYIITPGESIEFDVYYTPQTYEENNTHILINSNDEDKEYYELPVSGNGDAPLLSITPTDISFGDISIGCIVDEVITIRNNGNLDLQINSLLQMATPPVDILVDFGTLSPLPWILSPGQEIDFNIRYEPLDVNHDESQLTITSNDPVNSEVIILQDGTGDIVHWYQDQYVQDESRLVDILFVVDNSGSMSDQQSELAAQMNDFMSVLINMNVDYHLGFITTDSAVLQEFDGHSWIDSRYPEPVDWSIQVINSIGIYGSPYEQGINYAYQFAAMASTSNSRYWRDAANFAIVYISDEPDFSPGGYASYFNFFDTVKSSSSLVRQFAVIGDYPSGCIAIHPVLGVSYSVPFGAGYYEMTQRYNGSIYSICAPDWGIQMQNLAVEVAIRSSFQLAEDDVMEETIEVRVNGQIIADWIFDEDENAIVFNSESIPESGNTIDISYATLGCGE